MPDSRPSPEQIGDQVGTILSAALAAKDLREAIVSPLTDRATLFARLLALWGARMNLVAEPQNPDEIAFHILDSLAPMILEPADCRKQLTSLFTAGKRVLDLGSGAGFPGLILALASQAHFTLAEARRKRASFLTVAAAELGLENVTVLSQHLSPHALPSSNFDLVVSRASGALSDFYPLAAQMLGPGGGALLYLNPSQRLDVAGAESCGFSGCRRYPYSIARAGKRVERILVHWWLA